MQYNDIKTSFMMSNEQNLTVEYFLQEGSDNLGDLLKNVDKVCSVSRTKSAKCCEKLSGLFAMINHLENLRDTYENCNVFVDEKFETVRVEVNDILGKKQYFVLISEKEGKLKIKEHSLPDLDSLSSKFNGWCYNMFISAEQISRFIFANVLLCLFKAGC